MTKIDRHHDLDALRSTMLLLGLVIHAGQGYFPKSNGMRNPELWYFYDETTSLVAAPLCGAIHVYRMPVFFVLAGFFAALLVAKRGVGGLIKNRLNRVAVPLAISLLAIVPMIFWSAKFAWQSQGGAPEGFGVTSGWAGMFSDNLYHLWFLWHLLLLYAFTLVAAFFQEILKSRIGFPQLGNFVSCLVLSNWGIVVLIVLTTGLVMQMQGLPGTIESSFSFFPPWYLLGIYGLCYSYGWALFRNRQRIPKLAEHANRRMFVGVAAITCYLGLLGWNLKFDGPKHLQPVLAVLSAISIWTMLEGWLAIFQKYFHRASPVARYLSDSSYWVYLLHVPITLVFQGCLAELNLPADLKFFLTLVLTTIVCLISYHFLVRATLIGQILNGRRYDASIKSLFGSR